jgi:hypothetical protein
MIELREFNGAGANAIATFTTFAEAEAFARATYPVAFFEADADYADCADFITDRAEVFAIQPVGFKL